jgi:ADP-heptose:LPS heptosyltransferase
MTEKGIASFDNIDNWHHLDSFAALIAACDKVVSIDNSTVHFAGALGKECHVLLPHSCDWRWGLQQHKDSHWYKSMSLHRQTKLNDWSDAIKSLQSALNENSPS